MTKRVISSSVVKAPTVNLDRIEEVIDLHFEKKVSALVKEGKTPRPATHVIMKREMMVIVKEVIEPQLVHGRRLDLSDKLIMEHLDVKDRRARQLRSEIKEIGITYFPFWSKPRKMGDYPYWMIRHEFLTFPEDDKPKRVVKNKKYKSQYYNLRKESCKLIYAELDSYDAYVSVQTFMMMVYQNLNDRIRSLGITKESLLR